MASEIEHKIMPTYETCPPDVRKLSDSILRQFETHHPLIRAGVKIDLLFAWPKYDEKDRPIGDALKKNGVKALGISRVVNLKDRTKGHGDAEILIDGEWWKTATLPEQTALLDHELHHVAVIYNKADILQTDDLGRPKIRLRKHDHDYGWFDVIAERHGKASIECRQARALLDSRGQLYWPLEGKAEGTRFSKIAQEAHVKETP